jgi:hypothetical protein
MPSVATAPQLSREDLDGRLGSNVYALYMNYSFLIKGGVFTVAALVLYVRSCWLSLWQRLTVDH